MLKRHITPKKSTKSMSIFWSRDRYLSFEKICHSFLMLHCIRMPLKCKYCSFVTLVTSFSQTLQEWRFKIGLIWGIGMPGHLSRYTTLDERLTLVKCLTWPKVRSFLMVYRITEERGDNMLGWEIAINEDVSCMCLLIICYHTRMNYRSISIVEL